VLYNFCSVANCADGLQPYAGVILNVSGNLVGTTFLGGSGYGVAFELVNSGGSWSETIVHSFCSLSGCTDGENPNADLIIDGSGRILGMTQGDGSTAWGNVFELVPR
jgi:hypothetical protein